MKEAASATGKGRAEGLKAGWLVATVLSLLHCPGLPASDPLLYLFSVSTKRIILLPESDPAHLCCSFLTMLYKAVRGLTPGTSLSLSLPPPPPQGCSQADPLLPSTSAELLPLGLCTGSSLSLPYCPPRTHGSPLPGRLVWARSCSEARRSELERRH